MKNGKLKPYKVVILLVFAVLAIVAIIGKMLGY